jgi:hypothetical protein
MTWNGGLGGHSELATATPSRKWYFAEGATHGRFELFYLLFNPGPGPASVSMTYLLPSGRTSPRHLEIPAGQRTTVWVDQDGRDVASTDVAAVIESTNGQPIVAERAMYLTGGTGFVGGHVTLGATEPRSHWLMAEGATGPYFTTYVLLANPHAQPAPVQLRFRRPDGLLVRKDVTVPAGTRITVDVATLDRLLIDTAFWTEVTSSTTLPIVAERVMWWPGTNWQDGHAALAAPATAARWLVVGGQHGGVQRHATYVLIANATSEPQAAKVTVLGPQGPMTSVLVNVAAGSRYNVDMAATFPGVRGRYSVLVESVGGAGRLVVEQATYWDADGQAWAAGTAGPAQPLDH